jgi:hypothetical protein
MPGRAREKSISYYISKNKTIIIKRGEYHEE